MRLLVVSKVPIFPVVGGNRSRIKTFCDEARVLGYHLSFVLLPAKDHGELDLARHKEFFGQDAFLDVKRHPILSLPFLFSTLIRREIDRVRYHLGWPHVRSDNIDYRLDGYVDRRVRHIIMKLNPEVLVVEYVHFSKVVLHASRNCLKIIDTHDSFEREFTPRAEGVRLRRAELVIAIQRIEADRFKDMVGDEARIHIVSHIVPQMDVVDTKQCEGFSFVGSSFDANNISLRWLFEKVLPIIAESRPGCRLFVAGTVCDAIPDDDRVVKLGKVDNLHAIYSRAPILANAISKGTGIKIKLLEAMASGVPVVSTRLGVAGIDERFLAGVAVVEDSDPIAFADEVIRLFDDASARFNAGRNALRQMEVWNEEQRQSLAAALSIRK